MRGLRARALGFRADRAGRAGEVIAGAIEDRLRAVFGREAILRAYVTPAVARVAHDAREQYSHCSRARIRVAGAVQEKYTVLVLTGTHCCPSEGTFYITRNAPIGVHQLPSAITRESVRLTGNPTQGRSSAAQRSSRTRTRTRSYRRGPNEEQPGPYYIHRVAAARTRDARPQRVASAVAAQSSAGALPRRGRQKSVTSTRNTAVLTVETVGQLLRWREAIVRLIPLYRDIELMNITTHK